MRESFVKRGKRSRETIKEGRHGGLPLRVEIMRGAASAPYSTTIGVQMMLSLVRSHSRAPVLYAAV